MLPAIVCDDVLQQFQCFGGHNEGVIHFTIECNQRDKYNNLIIEIK